MNDAAVTCELAVSIDALSVAVGGRPVLRDVSFTVGQGKCLALVGESGAGKTMVCRALTGRLARIGGRDLAGSVLFDGIDLLHQPAARWRELYGRRIALVPQNSLSSLDPVLRVGRQVKETIRELDPSASVAERSAELLDLVQLPRPREVLRAYPHQLSGGMRQRVMIALALAGRPDLLVADEPTSALDVTVQHGIMSLLGELRRLTGMSIVFVTHDLSIVQSIADDVAVMYAGTVVERGPAGTIFGAPQHPYTRALLAASPRPDRRAQELAAIPGQPSPLDVNLPGCQFAPRCGRVTPTCRSEVPELTGGSSGHLVACWNPEDKVR
jgi:oligopeptide/dipeptide ABC transporter ATP-binding protein